MWGNTWNDKHEPKEQLKEQQAFPFSFFTFFGLRVCVSGKYFHNAPTVSLVPPSLSTGTEVIFGPGRESDLSIFGGITVSQGKGQWGRSTDNGTIGRVLRTVAGAHEFVLCGRPWDDTSQVSADCVCANKK
jgi:hypothetical protein